MFDLKNSVILVVMMMVLLVSGVCFAQNYQESPMLTEKVEGGELPPVAERLPDNPCVVETVDGAEAAQYGGTMRMVHINPNRLTDAGLTNIENIVHKPGEGGTIGETGVQMVPNIVEEYKIGENAKEFTFTLRKGLKWSDGEPVTTEDVRFAYEDVLLNENLTPAFPTHLKIDGEECKVEIVDKYTFKVIFPEQYGGFIDELGTRMRGYQDLIMPKHFWSQYHIDYTSVDELKPILEEEELGEDEWWRLFDQIATRQVEIPTLTPWVMTERSNEKVVWERNPYYFKVDEAGNQLPYIDKRRSVLVGDAEMATMKVIAGEVDFIRENVKLDKAPLYKRKEEDGGFKLFLYPAELNIGEIFINLSHQDPIWNEIINDLRFRKALNMSIDREEIIDVVFHSFGKPAKRTPPEFNPEKAKQLLDEMGLDQKDSEGYRLGPDGERFVIPFEVAELMGFELPMTELLVKYFENIGLRTTMKTISFNLWAQRGASNEIKASVHWNGSNEVIRNDIPYARELMPSQFRSWGAGYRPWYETNGEEGVEPGSELKKYFDLYDQSKFAVARKDRLEAVNKMLEMLNENLFWISTTLPRRGIIASADMGGLPAIDQTSDAFVPFTCAMQYYFEE